MTDDAQIAQLTSMAFLLVCFLLLTSGCRHYSSTLIGAKGDDCDLCFLESNRVVVLDRTAEGHGQVIWRTNYWSKLGWYEK
jgi:hypothetical protein